MVFMRIANDSFLGWCRFALAKDFVGENHDLYPYQQTTIERCGRALRWGVGSVADVLLREIRNPITIIALGALAAFAVTIVFYPATITQAVVSILPFAARFEPWMAKMGLYILTQTTILGVTLRGYGRLDNDALVAAWRRNAIEPIFIGAKRY